MFASYLPEFIAISTVHFLAVMAPGPDFAVTVSQSVRHGKRVGRLTALGIGCGISVHVLYTILGIGALMHTTPGLMTAARWLGGAYVLYLGIQLLRAKPKTASEQPDTAIALDSPNGWQAFRRGFLTNATNPKATMFFLAIFTTIVSSRTPMQIQALYGLWMCITTAGWFLLVSTIFATDRIRAAFQRMGHWFERCMGVVLVGFAGKLLIIR